jgi:hypothetical protein
MRFLHAGFRIFFFDASQQFEPAKLMTFEPHTKYASEQTCKAQLR